MPSPKASRKKDKAQDSKKELKVLEDHFGRCTLIEASAGTGKTWTLTALYARFLLERRLRVENILVVTYTNAATAELRERIRNRLAELLDVALGAESEDPLCRQFVERYVKAEDPAEELANKNRLLLAVHGFDEAAVFTIHSFCQRALQDSAFHAGADFDNVLTPDDHELIEEVLIDAWRKELTHASPLWAQYLISKKVTPKWLKQRLRGHLGKPYLTIFPDNDHAAEQQAEQQSEAAFAKLESVWQEAAHKWQKHGEEWLNFLCVEQGEEVLNQRSHSEPILRAAGKALDRYFLQTKVLPAPDSDKWKRLTIDSVLNACKKGKAISFLGPDIALRALGNALSDLEYQFELVAQSSATRLAQLQSRFLALLNQQLPERKRLQRVLSYDDLLNQLNDALKGPQGERLAEALRQKYPIALIDEFQDTDPIQYEIFKRIYIDPPADAGKKSNTCVCFVGDPKQAIYAFRGADLDTYLTAKTQTEQQFNLAINYRSTPELLKALNHLFQRNRPFSFPENELTYHPVGAPEKDRKRLVLPAEEGKAALSWVWFESGDDEDPYLTKGQAEALVVKDTAIRIARILAAPEQGQAGFYPSENEAETTVLEPLKGGDIAVLVANHRQAAAIAESLQELGIPCVRKGRDGVWHSEEAEELAAVLMAYADPSQEGALRYALATRLLGYDAQQLTQTQSNQRLWDEERADADHYHKLWLEQGFLQAFRQWLEEKGVAARLLKRSDGERRLTNLLHLGELLEKQQEQRPGMEPLLRWFAEQRSQEHVGDEALLRLESDAERVQIVTIHTSKGLEYPLVFCPFLWDGRLLGQQQEVARCHDSQGASVVDFGSVRFESNLNLSREETFAEHLRLVYVALTRPRERLWVHWGALKYKTKKGELLEEGLHTSALAWLIHGRDINPEENSSVLEALGGYLKGLDKPELQAELLSLIQAAGPDMGCCSVERTTPEHLKQPDQASAPTLLKSQLDRTLYSPWRIGSFSGLTAGQHNEAPDHDGRILPSVAEPGEGIYAFPRGARAGTCLHAILEDWARDKGALSELTQAALQAYGLPIEATELITQHLEQVLNHPLDGKALSLATLPAERRLPELGFTFPVAHLDVTALKKILTNPEMGLPEPLRQAAKRLEFNGLKGFLKGFIDLTFEYQGRWYILDYKSNWLGPDASYYTGEQLEQALAAEHYYLQYLIYLVALRRFLRQRFPENTPPLGGAYYLFLRGMPEAGVYFDCPAEALLDALDELFEQGASQ